MLEVVLHFEMLVKLFVSPYLTKRDHKNQIKLVLSKENSQKQMFEVNGSFCVVKSDTENHFCGVVPLTYPAINTSDKNAALRLLGLSQ